jgi:hypothetical protein
MGIESGRSPGVPDRNGETSETGGYSDGKALSYSSCRGWGIVRDRSDRVRRSEEGLVSSRGTAPTFQS